MYGGDTGTKEPLGAGRTLIDRELSTVLVPVQRSRHSPCKFTMAVFVLLGNCFQVESTTSSVEYPLTSWVSMIGRLGSTGVFPVTALPICVLTTLSPSIVASVIGICKVLFDLSV